MIILSTYVHSHVGPRENLAIYVSYHFELSEESWILR